MFDFPSSPALGQAFYAPGGPVYVWDGVTWQAQPGSAVANVLWSDTAPVAPFNGQLWGNSLTGILYSWYVDPNSSQWVAISGGAPASVKTARTRNRVINPTAQVSQENGSTAVTTANGYPADMWMYSVSALVGSAQRATMAPPSPEGTKTGVALQVTTAKPSLAAGDYQIVILPMEGLDTIDLLWGTAQAKPVVVRFNAICDTAGTYGFAIVNGTANNRSYCGSFTLTTTATWQAFSFAVPGDTTGAWNTDNTGSLWLCFTYACGTTQTGVAGWQAGLKLAPPGISNGAAVINKVLSITDVGLYSDPDATGVAPRFEAPSYEDDLARCQRYWFKQQSAFLTGYNAAGAQIYETLPLPVTMRSSPSVGYTNVGNAGNATTLLTTSGAPTNVTSQVQAVAAGAVTISFDMSCSARLI